jgi:hypothetical protein
MDDLLCGKQILLNPHGRAALHVDIWLTSELSSMSMAQLFMLMVVLRFIQNSLRVENK